MRREEAAARARLLPSTAALVSSAEVIKSLDGYFEEKSPFEAHIYQLWGSGCKERDQDSTQDAALNICIESSATENLYFKNKMLSWLDAFC